MVKTIWVRYENIVQLVHTNMIKYPPSPLERTDRYKDRQKDWQIIRQIERQTDEQTR